MKHVDYIFAITLGLLILMGVEGLFSWGRAFEFSNYTLAGYVGQVLAVIFTVCLSIKICHTERGGE